MVMAPDWSMLPRDLVADIALKLESFESFINFSAVCRPWNRAWSCIKHQWMAKPVMPWLLLAENTNNNPDCVRKMFNLDDNKYYGMKLPETFGARCWGSPYGWVAMVGYDLNIQLFNPISRAHISFPTLYTLPTLVGPEYIDGDYSQWCLMWALKKLVTLKLMSPPPSSQGHDDEFGIIILTGRHVAFARPGDESWTLLAIRDTGYIIADIVCIDDYVFALYEDGRIGYWDVEKLFRNLELVESKEEDRLLGEPEFLELLREGWTKAYLVQCGSDILLVVRYKEEVLNLEGTDYNYDIVYETIHIEVYKLNPKDNSLEITEDIGDFALFVGSHNSICVSVEAQSLQRNCIYFTDDQHESWNMVPGYLAHDMGVHDLKSDETRSLCQGSSDTRALYCPPTWFIPHF